MNTDKKIVFISNCGLIFIVDKELVIIDGVVKSDNKFTKHNLTLKEEMHDLLAGFDGHRTMLFTHCHNDHFDDKQVAQYVINGNVDQLILPHDIENGAICNSLVHTTYNIVSISDKEYYERRKSINIKFIKSQHIEYQNYSDVNCYSIELEIANRRYLILGDTSPYELDNVILSTTGKADYIFINPVILGKKEWVRKLYDWNSDAGFIVYHIPDDDMDFYGYRKMAENKVKEYRDFIPNIKMLFEKRMVIY